MKFLIAYIKAFLTMAAFGGTLYLARALFQPDGLLAHYIVYVCAVAAVAGPLNVLLESSKK